MNEEEKQAIKYFYNLRATIDESNMLFDEDINIKCGKEMIKQITTVLNLLEKKDKIIDEMATYIATLDIEEDICEKTKNEHCDKMNFGECEDCIKQYFIRGE